MSSKRPRDAGLLEAEIPQLRRFSRVLVRGDQAAADDLVQETLLRALRSLTSFRADASLSTWLTAIMLNVHRSQKRVAKRKPEEPEADTELPEPSEPARQEQRIEVMQTMDALDALPEEQRLAIALVSIHEMSYRDAAESLGVKLGTLMSRISRGRAAMRAQLEGQAGGASMNGGRAGAANVAQFAGRVGDDRHG